MRALELHVGPIHKLNALELHESLKLTALELHVSLKLSAIELHVSS